MPGEWFELLGRVYFKTQPVEAKNGQVMNTVSVPGGKLSCTAHATLVSPVLARVTVSAIDEPAEDEG